MLTRLGRDILRQTRFLRLTRASAACSTFLRSPQKNEFHNLCRDFSVFSKSPDYSEVPLMDLLVYETLSTETLESLTDYFEQIVDTDAKLKSADVVYSDGVLTVKLGPGIGTYVINRQTPNRQIWLSSPTSGPKRYDYINDSWIYKHDGMSLHQLLQNELEKIISIDVDFLKLASSKNK